MDVGYYTRLDGRAHPDVTQSAARRAPTFLASLHSYTLDSTLWLRDREPYGATDFTTQQSYSEALAARKRRARARRLREPCSTTSSDRWRRVDLRSASGTARSTSRRGTAIHDRARVAGRAATHAAPALGAHALSESYIFGDVDVEGDLEAAADLGDIAASRLRSPRALFRLARHVLALPRDEKHKQRRRGDSRCRHICPVGVTRRSAIVTRFAFTTTLATRSTRSGSTRGWCTRAPISLHGDDDLDRAQESKLDLICRKLRLKPGERLLDIGCGWGGLIMHAARRYGVFALGITLSEAQAELARERIAAAGLSDRCRVELRDYRQLTRDPTFDKIASVGMVEHVGQKRLDEYFASAFARATARRSLPESRHREHRGIAS